MKKTKGITLIALIITVIVLLILAGVSISIVTGDNGVLKQAQTSLKKTNLETAKEDLSMAWANCQAEYLESITKNANSNKSTYFTPAKMNGYLTGKGTVNNFTYEADGETVIVYTKANNSNEVYKFNVSPSGEIEVGTGVAEVTTSVSATDIVNYMTDSSKVQEYYGHSVKYNGDDDWEILYVGSDFKAGTDNRIYLISKTNRNSSYYPNSNYGTAADVISDAGNLCAWWNAYGSGVNSSSNPNAQAVAGMLTMSNWTSTTYKPALPIGQTEPAEWIIGGPTEDIFLRSYNQYNGLTGDNAFRYDRNNAGEASENFNSPGVYDFNAIGYYYNRSSGTKNPSISDTFANGTVYNRGYYFLLASPSSDDARSVRSLYPNYATLSNHVYDYNGIRPLVCLKSEARITKGSSGWTVTMP